MTEAKLVAIEELEKQGTIIQIQDGNHGEKHPVGSDYVDEGVPFIMAKDIINGNVDLVNCKFLTKEHADSLRIGFAKARDVLLTHKGTVGSVAIVPEIHDYIMLTPQVTYYRVDPKQIDNRYLAYAFQTLEFQAQLRSFSAQSTRPYIGITAQRKLEVISHPLPIQRRIAGILSAYDDLIKNNTRRIKILEEMAQAIYREWFVHFRYPGHEKVKMGNSPLGKIPEGWEVRPFTDLANVLSGGTPRTTEREFWNGDIPFFAPKDVPASFYVTETEKSISSLGLSKCNSRLYSKNTVFITARGTVGKVVMPAVNMAMNQSCYALKGKEGFNQLFIFFMVKNQVAHLKQNTGGATFDTIVVDTFQKLQIMKPLPPIAAEFEKIVSSHMKLILNLTFKNATLRNTRNLLLPKLISGELDVDKLRNGRSKSENLEA